MCCCYIFDKTVLLAVTDLIFTLLTTYILINYEHSAIFLLASICDVTCTESGIFACRCDVISRQSDLCMHK